MTADRTPPPPASRRMTDLPTDDRPRERLLRLGGEAMTDAELVAILLRTGVKGHNVAELAREFVASLGVEGLTALRNYGHDELRALVRRQEHDLRGIGDDKIATLLAALEFGARVFGPAPRELGKPILVASDVVRHFFGEQTRCVREGFWLLALDHRRALIGRKPALLTTGVRSQTVIDVPTVFQRALLLGASSIIVVHNHPSGDVTPSPQDIETTRALIRAGQTLGLPLRDHVILGRPDIPPHYCSLRASGCCAFL